MAMRMRILRKGFLFCCTTWWLGSYTRQLVALQGGGQTVNNEPMAPNLTEGLVKRC